MTAPRALVPICVALVCSACASPAVHGGATASPRHMPDGRPLSSYRATDCRDATGAPFSHSARVYLVADPEGGSFLVDAVPSYDALVVRNQFSQGGERVFQAVLDDGDRKPVLVDYRLPRGGGDGRMAAARWFSSTESDTGELRAKIVEVSFACKLLADEQRQPEEPAP